MSSADDVLGLDEQLTVTKRAKVPKIDQERLLGKKGVSYIAKNYHKVNRIMKRNDLKNKAASKSAKVEAEFDNLTSVLQFYQLWCHTLFPKAKFYDCIQLIRGVTNRSPMLKQYRRELIEAEITKLKESMGIIDVPYDDTTTAVRVPDRANESETPAASRRNDIAATNDIEEEEDDYHVEDDDFFNSMTGGNALFVDPNEDLYGDNDASTEPHYMPPATQQTQKSQSGATQEAESQSQSQTQSSAAAPVAPPTLDPVSSNDDDDENAFSDDEEFLSAANGLKDPKPPVLGPVLESVEDETIEGETEQGDTFEAQEDDHDEEWNVMNELNM